MKAAHYLLNLKEARNNNLAEFDRMFLIERSELPIDVTMQIFTDWRQATTENQEADNEMFWRYFRNGLEIDCPHDNTIDVGDPAEWSKLFCTDCGKEANYVR